MKSSSSVFAELIDTTNGKAIVLHLYDTRLLAFPNEINTADHTSLHALHTMRIWPEDISITNIHLLQDGPEIPGYLITLLYNQLLTSNGMRTIHGLQHIKDFF